MAPSHKVSSSPGGVVGTAIRPQSVGTLPTKNGRAKFRFLLNQDKMPWVAFNRALGLAALTRPAVEYEGLYKHTWRHSISTVMPMT